MKASLLSLPPSLSLTLLSHLSAALSLRGFGLPSHFAALSGGLGKLGAMGRLSFGTKESSRLLPLTVLGKCAFVRRDFSLR